MTENQKISLGQKVGQLVQEVWMALWGIFAGGTFLYVMLWAVDTGSLWFTLLITFACLGVAIAGTFDLMPEKARALKWFQKVIQSVGVIITTVGCFGVFSYLIDTDGFQTAADHPFEASEYMNYYIWTTFDMIPGLQINETMEFKPHVAPSGGWAGFIVLIFRGFMIFFVIKVVRDLWKKRESKTPADPKTTE